MIKLIHAADFHLDSPFTGCDIRMAEMRREELRSTFVNFMMYAKEKQVDLLLLSGDIFDGDTLQPKTVDMVEREFRSLTERGTKIIIAPGNHDPYTKDGIWSKLKLPEGVIVFTSEKLSAVDFPEWNVTVWGYGFRTAVMTKNPFADGNYTLRSDRINILCGHGDLYAATGNCPITPAQIRASGFDYLALGHIHKASGLQKEGESYYAYPGCPEGRDFGECGEKGALIAILEKENGKFRMESAFQRFGKRRYEILELDVSEFTRQEELLEQLKTDIRERGLDGDTLLRIRFMGQADPLLKLSEGALQPIASRLCALEVLNMTTPKGTEEDFLNDPTVRGEFYRLLLPILHDGSAEEKEIAAKALHYGLSALNGGDVTDF